MVRWEYRVLHDVEAHELNEIGDEGWEIITAEFDEEGDIFSALAKRPSGGGGGSSGGSAGGNRRRRRRGGNKGGNGGNIGPMT
jgi:hypothetical protein